MKSGIKDRNGIEVKAGDNVVFPYIDPMGTMTETSDFEKTIVFEHGCFGYYTETMFTPLYGWMRTEAGEYVPNCGTKTIYTSEYPFWIDND